MKPWHLRDPAFFDRERSEVQQHYPDLQFRIVGEHVVVEGGFPLIVDGKVRDRYQIEITLAKDHPKSLPMVRETAERIPRVVERHMNANGTACVLLADERWKSWPVGAPLLQFLTGPVHNYFVCQSVVEAGDPWPMKQLPHGVDGIRMYYREMLGIEDDRMIAGFLSCLAATQVKGHWDCPCASGRRLRDCHLKMVLDLRAKISGADARISLRYLVPPGKPN